MELTAENVEKILSDCLCENDDDMSQAKKISVITATFSFVPEKLEEHKEDIKQLLDQLPDNFKLNEGGGWSFLNAVKRNDGVQWAEHRDVEMLLALGIATDQAEFLMTSQFWPSLPGGMPYFAVIDQGGDSEN